MVLVEMEVQALEMVGTFCLEEEEGREDLAQTLVGQMGDKEDQDDQVGLEEAQLGLVEDQGGRVVAQGGQVEAHGGQVEALLVGLSSIQQG